MKNIVDKITDDSNNIVITTKSAKWILGILASGVIGIIGFAWNLYIAVDEKVDKVKDEIIGKMEQLDREKVKPSVDKNYMQDMDIVRLYERTNTKDAVPVTTGTVAVPSPNTVLPSLNRR